MKLLKKIRQLFICKHFWVWMYYLEKDINGTSFIAPLGVKCVKCFKDKHKFKAHI